MKVTFHYIFAVIFELFENFNCWIQSSPVKSSPVQYSGHGLILIHEFSIIQTAIQEGTKNVWFSNGGQNTRSFKCPTARIDTGHLNTGLAKVRYSDPHCRLLSQWNSVNKNWNKIVLVYTFHCSWIFLIEGTVLKLRLETSYCSNHASLLTIITSPAPASFLWDTLPREKKRRQIWSNLETKNTEDLNNGTLNDGTVKKDFCYRTTIVKSTRDKQVTWYSKPSWNNAALLTHWVLLIQKSKN